MSLATTVLRARARDLTARSIYALAEGFAALAAGSADAAASAFVLGAQFAVEARAVQQVLYERVHQRAVERLREATERGDVLAAGLSPERTAWLRGPPAPLP